MPPESSPPTEPPPAPAPRRPWTDTARTAVIATAALLPLLPDIAAAAHIETVPAVIVVLGVAATVQRVIAVPGVELWLQRALPVTPDPPVDMTPKPKTGRHRK